jgi:uncharacterized membrane protein YedE/YeeE
MDLTVHQGVLASAFVGAAVLGAVVNKTNFCTMGGVADWVSMGHTGRLRAWLLAIAVALGGVLALEAGGYIQWGEATFPPYRSANFSWLRHILGGLLFGCGMTLASGCGNKSLVRIGGGNLKSLVVLVIAAIMSYLMLWTDFYGIAFDSWISPLSINLSRYGIKSQELGAIVDGLTGLGNAQALHLGLGGAIVLALLGFTLGSADFRRNRDNVLGGIVVGLAVVAGWYLTGGRIGQAWKEWADMADVMPSRVQVQSLTFISPMGDAVHYLTDPGNFYLINFGIAALAGVLVGSSLYSVMSGNFRLEWFPSLKDFARHVVGAILIGVGGVLAMGCTIGQGITGVSTLAVGSMLALASIVAGSVFAMKLQYRFA